MQRPFILDLTKSWSEQTPYQLPVNHNGNSWVMDWSPDGNKLLMLLFNPAGGADGIAVYDLKTSTYEKMAENGTSCSWLKDNRHFIFNDDVSVFLCDTKTKKITEILKPSAYEIQNVNISADNTIIYFRYLQIDADVWLIDASQNQ